MAPWIVKKRRSVKKQERTKEFKMTKNLRKQIEADLAESKKAEDTKKKKKRKEKNRNKCKHFFLHYQITHANKWLSFLQTLSFFPFFYSEWHQSSWIRKCHGCGERQYNGSHFYERSDR